MKGSRLRRYSDKAAVRAKAATTLGAVIDMYLCAKKQELRPKSFDETERYLRKYWRRLHGLPVHKIERPVVAARLTEITTENGPIAAARARAELSGLIAWAVGEGVAEQNAVIGTNKPAVSEQRERVLSDDVIIEVWNACRNDDYGRIVRLLFLTGHRRDEVGAMAWSELDLDQGTWCSYLWTVAIVRRSPPAIATTNKYLAQSNKSRAEDKCDHAVGAVADLSLSCCSGGIQGCETKVGSSHPTPSEKPSPFIDPTPPR